jgi:CheY-like chemotaxis protein
MGYIDLALSNGLSSDYQQDNLEGLKIAKSSGELLLTIIQDILDLSKIEAGSMRLHEDEVYSLEALVDAATNTAKRLVESKQKKIKIVSKVDPGICDSMLGDQFRLAQILNNLLSNAVKFTAEGQVSVAVTLSEDGLVQIQVQDTGKGIPQSFIETVFQPFRQVEIGDTRNHGGTGLGLTISRKLARMMGGDLRVESSIEDTNHGSCFTVTFPYRPSKTKAVQPDTINHLERHRQRRESMGKIPKKILVSEDDPVSRRMIHRMLTRSGYEVVLACNGEEAVSKYTNNRDVGLILMGKCIHDSWLLHGLSLSFLRTHHICCLLFFMSRRTNAHYGRLRGHTTDP